MRNYLGPRRTGAPLGPGLGALVVAFLILAGARAQAQEPADVATTAFSPRIRFGGSAGLGLGSMGFAGAASARLGVQIGSRLAASYQITAAGTSEIFGDDDTWTSHALLFELVPSGSMVALGAGPALVRGTITHRCGWASDCTPAPGSRNYWGPGLDARLAYTFGANRPSIRGGFTLELGVHVGPQDTSTTVGIGFDVF